MATTAMQEQHTTEELNHVLASAGPESLAAFLEEHPEQLIRSERAFRDYLRERLREKGLRQQDVFVAADIPERYGYKLISGEKHTRQRDTILRLCLAARLSLHETQTALKLYGMAPLYSRIPRDAALIIAFNTGLQSPHEADQLLADNGFAPLARCGEVQE